MLSVSASVSLAIPVASETLALLYDSDLTGFDITDFLLPALGLGFLGGLAAVVDAGGVKNPVSTLTSIARNEGFDS